MAVIVKRPVVVKNIVTQAFKGQLTTEIEQAIRQIEEWLEQEEFKSRRMISEAQKHDARRVSQLREQARKEREKQEHVRDNLKQKLEQVEQLAIDSLFVSGTYDAPVKIEVGDDIRTKLSQAEVVVKDGTVVRIIE